MRLSDGMLLCLEDDLRKFEGEVLVIYIHSRIYPREIFQLILTDSAYLLTRIERLRAG